MWKKSSKKQLGKAPKRKDDEKTQMTQIIGLIRPMLTYLFSASPGAWRVVLVYQHSISVSVIINYTNMAATSHAKLGFLMSKDNFCWIWTLLWKKKLVLYQPLLRQ